MKIRNTIKSTRDTKYERTGKIRNTIKSTRENTKYENTKTIESTRENTKYDKKHT